MAHRRAARLLLVLLLPALASSSGAPPPAASAPPAAAAARPASVATISADAAPPPLLRVSMVTWNLATKSPSQKDVDRVVKPLRPDDVIVVCAQECDDSIGARQNVGQRAQLWRALVRRSVGKRHTLLCEAQLGALQLSVFSRDPSVRVHQAGVTTGVGGVLQNKGAIAAALRLPACAGGGPAATLLFVNAHMAAHAERARDRDRDFAKIARDVADAVPQAWRPRGQQTMRRRRARPEDRYDDAPEEDEDPADKLRAAADLVFFGGDLNYRLDLTRAEVSSKLASVGIGGRPALDGGRGGDGAAARAAVLAALLVHDQLTASRGCRRAFGGFAEAPVLFAPTFKLDRGTDVYDSSEKQRVPAWTDRVLHKPAKALLPTAYRSVESVRSSDHRPVVARFTVDRSLLRPAGSGTQGRPRGRGNE